jgi:hypothetical protein
MITSAVTIALCVFSVGILKEALFPPVPSSEPIMAPEPIPTSKPIPNSEKIPVRTLASGNEMESALSWEFQQGAYQQTTRFYGQFLSC